MKFLNMLVPILIMLYSQALFAGLFSFIKCGGGNTHQTLCRFCIASSAGGSNRVCSKPYDQNFEHKNGVVGGASKSIGFKSLSEDLVDDFANKIVEIKEFPKENFDVKEFYEKYAEYSCERATEEIKGIDIQLSDFSKDKEKDKSWSIQQVKYLKWKREKIKESMSQKSCPK